MYFVNLNNEHWTVLHRSMDGDVTYFDPGAEAAPPQLLACLDKSCTYYVRNNFDLQKEANDLNCGLYCILYAYCKLAYDWSMDYIVLYISMLKRSKKWVNCVDRR